jgi:hypothetical protein
MARQGGNKMKYGNFSLWDWRPWTAVLAVIVLTFWLYLGCGYAQAMAGDSHNLVPISKALLGFISVETINQYLTFLILAFLATIFIIVWLIVKAINGVINRYSVKKIEDIIMMEIPAYTDEMIRRLNAKLGITVTTDEVSISQEILHTASIESLAYNVGWLLYLSYKEIEIGIQMGRYTALHSLADLLLTNWPEEKIKDFVAALSGYKEYISNALDAALCTRSIELKIDELSKELSAWRERQLSLTRESDVSDDLVGRLNHYHEIRSGKSATVKWLKKWLKRQAGRISFGF